MSRHSHNNKPLQHARCFLQRFVVVCGDKRLSFFFVASSHSLLLYLHLQCRRPSKPRRKRRLPLRCQGEEHHATLRRTSAATSCEPPWRFDLLARGSGNRSQKSTPSTPSTGCTSVMAVASRGSIKPSAGRRHRPVTPSCQSTLPWHSTSNGASVTGRQSPPVTKR